MTKRRPLIGLGLAMSLAKRKKEGRLALPKLGFFLDSVDHNEVGVRRIFSCNDSA